MMLLSTAWVCFMTAFRFMTTDEDKLLILGLKQVSVTNQEPSAERSLPCQRPSPSCSASCYQTTTTLPPFGQVTWPS